MIPSVSSQCRLDHLVITASDLAQGVAWFHGVSGLVLPVGGVHPLMGTHNHLTALSDTSYLEIIAIDPDAPDTTDMGTKRWFSLDDDAHQAKLQVRPRLTTWVVATTDLDASIALARRAGIDPGDPVTQTRGDLQWRLSLRADGSLAAGGVFPVLIEWPEGVNPVARMSDQGIRLQALRVFHPEAEKLLNALNAIGIAEQVSLVAGEIALRAEFTAALQPFAID